MTNIAPCRPRASLATWGCLALDTLLATGCAPAGLPEGVLDPTDCSSLKPVSDGLREQIEQGTTVLTDQDVPAQSAHIILTVDIGDGPAWYSHVDADEPWMVEFADDGVPLYSTRIVLPCEPEAAAFVAFQLDEEQLAEPLDEGVYPLFHFGWDVAQREQGSAEPTWSKAELVLTDVHTHQVSGYLLGRGGGELISFFTQEPIGFIYTVEALAFHDIKRW